MDSKSKLKELNRSRGRIKTKLTNISKYVDEYNPSQDTEKDVINIQERLKSLTQLKIEIEKLFDEYLQINDDKEETSVAEADKIMCEVENLRDSLEVSLKCLLAKLNVYDTFENKSSEIKSNNSSPDIITKLPEIPLPTFSGKIEDFLNFKINFENLISKNVNLNKEQKLYYLKAALRGEAKLIESSDDTYDSLFLALEKRYENKRAVIDIHIQSILKIERMQFESAKALKNITDIVNKALRSLKILNLKCDDLSNAILINILLEKIDKESRKAYELSLTSKDTPSLINLIEFLESRSVVLEQLNKIESANSQKGNQRWTNKHNSLIINSDKSSLKPCVLCNLFHRLHKCSKFLNMSINERIDVIKKFNLCKNCLKLHSMPCKSAFICRYESCGLKHHSLLHLNNFDIQNTVASESVSPAAAKSFSQSAENESICGTSLMSNQKEFNASSLLCTVGLLINNAFGKKIKVKAILDCGSTVTVMSSELANNLGLKKEKTNSSISGINGGKYSVKNKVSATISNERGDFCKTLSFLILPKITDHTPANKLNISDLNIPSEINLADPSFHIPSKIDILIGNDLFFELLKPEKFKSYDETFLFQNSIFGYLVTRTAKNSTLHHFTGLVIEQNSLNGNAKKCSDIKCLTANNYSENLKSAKTLGNHFCDFKFPEQDNSRNHVFSSTLKEDKLCSSLSDSMQIKELRLNNLSNKLDKNKTRDNQYKIFMDENISSIQMEGIPFLSESKFKCFTPIYANHQMEDLTNDLHVLFDTSTKNSAEVKFNSRLNKNQNDHIQIKQNLSSSVVHLCNSVEVKETVTIPKIIIQELWSQNLNWPILTSTNDQKTWLHLFMCGVCNVQVPNFLIASCTILVELQVTNDNFKCVSSALIYLISIKMQQQVQSRVMCNKFIISSKKASTTSCLVQFLVLVAALLIARLIYNATNIPYILRQVLLKNLPYLFPTPIDLSRNYQEKLELKIYYSTTSVASDLIENNSILNNSFTKYFMSFSYRFMNHIKRLRHWHHSPNLKSFFPCKFKGLFRSKGLCC